MVESKEIRLGVIRDNNADGEAVGSGILGIKNRIPPEELKRLQFETA